MIEGATLWLAIIAYAAASALFAVGLAFGKKWADSAAIWLSAVGTVSLGVSLGLRWARVGHAPYLGFYEVAALLAFLAALTFLLLVWWKPAARGAGAVLMPVAFLILGATTLVSSDVQEVTGALASVWLAIHVTFANLAFAAYAAAFVLGVVYLLRDRPQGRRSQHALLERFPDQQAVDALIIRFVAVGFVFQGAMIASGAVWANEAWGRYWAWDPVETWSLIAWAVYALYLHLRLTLGWTGRRSAWIAVIALPVILFSLLGVPLVYESIHGAYVSP